ncbi:MAG TPA: beta/gamma crystallin-related protein [Pyrinomonadaceae bacterium]|nr:beta/gamma crystallin-related protein [Pyrinomonadaceae bacterium]
MRLLSLFVYFLVLIAVIGNPVVSSAQERKMGGVGITIFSDQNFRGKSSTFREDVPDLEPLGLNDKISSLRVGPGEQWEVCEHSNYQGRCVVVSGLEPDLRRNSWNDLISSLRRVRGGRPPVPPSGGDYIVLFDQTNYRGNPTNYNGPYPGLSGRAQSVTIGRGVWELCEGQNYSGRCVTLDRSVPDLRDYNLRNRVYSVRPVGSGAPQPPPSTGDWYVVLFDQANYRGTPRNYNGAVSDLGRDGRRAQSVTIGSGVWQLCENSNFRGRCITFETSAPSFPYFLKNHVSSLRPITRQPR